MFETDFERRVSSTLHVTPVTSRERTTRAIMDRVRASSPERGVLPFGAGRATRNSIIGLALAAGIGSVTTISALRSAEIDNPAAVTSSVIGDTVVNHLRDTLRLVRLMFDAPSSALQVAIVGDFNGWNAESNRMKKDEQTGKWAATLALSKGDHRYAIVVDNTRWPAPATPPASQSNATSFALLHVAASN